MTAVFFCDDAGEYVVKTGCLHPTVAEASEKGLNLGTKHAKQAPEMLGTVVAGQQNKRTKCCGGVVVAGTDTKLAGSLSHQDCNTLGASLFYIL
jgi:hypothetical protein